LVYYIYKKTVQLLLKEVIKVGLTPIVACKTGRCVLAEQQKDAP